MPVRYSALRSPGGTPLLFGDAGEPSFEPSLRSSIVPRPTPPDRFACWRGVTAQGRIFLCKVHPGGSCRFLPDSVLRVLGDSVHWTANLVEEKQEMTLQECSPLAPCRALRHAHRKDPSVRRPS